MTREEYSLLFHRLQLNLVAFKMLFQVDKEVLTLVNAAIEAEREACAKVADAEAEESVDCCYSLAVRVSSAIRARGDNNAS